MQSILCLGCVLVLLGLVQGQGTSVALSQAVNDFGTELSTLYCEGLSIGGPRCDSYGLSNFVDSMHSNFEQEPKDVSSTVRQIIRRVDDTLKERAHFLTLLANSLNVSCSAYRFGGYRQSESLADFDSMYFSGNAQRPKYLPDDIEDNALYGEPVTLSATSYKIPNGVEYMGEAGEHIQRDAQISLLMEETMLDLHDDYCVDSDGNEKYCSVYFGSVNGLFRKYPGVESPRDDRGNYISYDPRFRPWYVSAASGSKDVVILLDISGSMKTADRITLAKNAVISVLSTLGSSSMVAVVAFNHEITRSCFGNELVAATPRNVAKLIDFVEGLAATGSTNFELAFDAAFAILEEGASSCKTSVLFLTDGIAEDPAHIIRARNTADIGATIFSYTLGEDAKADIPWRVANMTNGVYTHIDDEDSSGLINKMSSYYLYYALGDSESNTDMIVTSPYMDFSTGVVMVTMAMPVYFNAYFAGVVGLDLPLTYLAEQIGDVIIGRRSYSFIVNEEGEVILHPLVPDPLTTLFTDDDEYNAVFIEDLEPAEFDVALLTSRQNGSVKVKGNFKRPAGDIRYNGYVMEEADVIYYYSGIGLHSLSLGIAIFTDAETRLPEVPGFGLATAPIAECDLNDTEPFDCKAPFVLYHDLERMDECESHWFLDADITFDGAGGERQSTEFAAWYLQAGGYDSPMDAVNTQPTCDELDALHSFTNGLPGVVYADDMPFGGFRTEVWGKLFSTVQTLPAMGQFWKPHFLADDNVFFGLYFASYQGLFVVYPAMEIASTYNPLIRPWFQRAASYPGELIYTTPYVDFFTGLLVATGATTINAPNASYPFGVAGFDYEYSEFLKYWDDTMSEVCDHDAAQYCYLVDSSAFLLYFHGIENHLTDDDISYKFLGDFEPALMQSLLERGFFVNDTHENYLENTRDISYMANRAVYDALDMNGTASTFGYNYGTYTVHSVGETNLYLVHIDGYATDYTLGLPSSDCPDVGCELVRAPGCIADSYGQCVSVVTDVCTDPDELSEVSTACRVPIVDDNIICILERGVESDMCASVFDRDCDEYDAAPHSISSLSALAVAFANLFFFLLHI